MNKTMWAAVLTLLTCACTSALAGGGPVGGNLGAQFEKWKACESLFRPDKEASAVSSRPAFVRPGNNRELIHNIELIWDRHLVLDPLMYSEDLLDDAFDGAKVTWKVSDMARSGGPNYVVAELASRERHGVVITVESRCWRVDSAMPGKARHTEIDMVGSLHVVGLSNSGMTLRTVRDVLGLEWENELEPGLSVHGVRTPTDTGFVQYLKPTGDSILSFTFQSRSQSRAPTSHNINDDDVVERIDISESQHQLLGN